MEQPFVCIDTRKGRIRLNKRCYVELQEPQFINILVNPEKDQMGIQRTETMTSEASRLKRVDFQQGHGDVYCPGLIQDLAVKFKWVKGRSYRLSALACIDGEMLVFSLRRADEVVITDKDSSQEDSNENQTECG